MSSTEGNDVLKAMSKGAQQTALLQSFKSKKEPTLPAVSGVNLSKNKTFPIIKTTHFLSVPYSILGDFEISIPERVLLSMITALDKEPDHCYATNKYFSDKLGLSIRHIRRMIMMLFDKEKIEFLDRNKNKRIMKSLCHDKE